MKTVATTLTAIAGLLADHATASAATMEMIKEVKLNQWAAAKAEGMFDVDHWEPFRSAVKCVDGQAGEFRCNNIDLVGFLRHQDVGSETRVGADLWGWTSPDGREFAIASQTDGTAFIEVNPDGTLTYLGRLGVQTVNSDWRDAKIIKNHAYIGSEAAGYGIQVFDLTRLLDIDPTSPVIFTIENDLTAHFAFPQGTRGNSHNLISHADTDMIFAVGVGARRDNYCRGGMVMIDVSDPSRPENKGCISENGYVHDAQCVTYTGPDSRYTGRTICFNYSEGHIGIVDVTDTANVKTLSRTVYAGATYVHQGWVADPEMRYLVADDEFDEELRQGPAANGHTTTYIIDISDLESPVVTGHWQGPTFATDHDQHVRNDLVYQANYGAGLRILNISSIPNDPTGGSVKEIGFFDTYPEDDHANDLPDFHGAWTAYPWFQSGIILVNTFERGIFSLKYSG